MCYCVILTQNLNLTVKHLAGLGYFIQFLAQRSWNFSVHVRIGLLFYLIISNSFLGCWLFFFLAIFLPYIFRHFIFPLVWISPVSLFWFSFLLRKKSSLVLLTCICVRGYLQADRCLKDKGNTGNSTVSLVEFWSSMVTHRPVNRLECVHIS